MAILGASGGGTLVATPGVVDTHMPRVSTEPPLHMRSGPKLKATSSAVIASPLWKRTLGRSLSSSVRPSMRRQLSASSGCSDRSPVQAWSVSVSAKV